MSEESIDKEDDEGAGNGASPGGDEDIMWIVRIRQRVGKGRELLGGRKRREEGLWAEREKRHQRKRG